MSKLIVTKASENLQLNFADRSDLRVEKTFTSKVSLGRIILNPL